MCATRPFRVDRIERLVFFMKGPVLFMTPDLLVAAGLLTAWHQVDRTGFHSCARLGQGRAELASSFHFVERRVQHILLVRQCVHSANTSKPV